jgi:[acyl-carrier-protein] S-malonyltransferase
MSLAVVFPGQGSQRVGMGRDWLEFPAAEEIFVEADEALSFDLSDLCFNGPEGELTRTANLQPALLTVSYAIYKCIEATLPDVQCFAGHSLGEYTALCAAGALSFSEAVRIVHERGKLMQQAVPAGEGAMAAVIGLAAGEIGKINTDVSNATGQPVEIANYNSPEQIVISGAAAAVALASERYTAAGAKRVVPLNVSAPFHSSLMVGAADGLRPLLDGAEWEPTSDPVISNLTVQSYPADTAQYPLLLHGQIFNSVRWTDTVQLMASRGVTHFLEVGPGKVLRMLAIKTVRDMQTFNVEEPEQLAALDDWLRGVGA